MNLTNYVKTSVGSGSTSAFPGSTGDASGGTTAAGYPFATTGFNMSDFDGAFATAIFVNSTGGNLKASLASSSGTAIASYIDLLTSSVTVSTALAGYSTTIFGLTLDVYRPSLGNKSFVAFTASVPSSSGYPTAIVVQQYGAKFEPTSVGTLIAGTTIAINATT